MKNEPELKVVERSQGSQQSASPKDRGRNNNKPKARPSKILPSIRIAFDKQLEVLRAYAAASGPSNNAVSVDEVADIVRIAVSSFPLINPFFCDIGFVQKVEQKGEAWKYVPSEHVSAFAKAWEWNRDNAAHKLAPIITASWFADALLRKLSFAPLDEEAAIAAIGEKASAGPDFKSQLRLLLEYMEAAGLVQIESGIVKAIRQSQTTVPAVKEHDQDAKDGQPGKTAMISTAFAQAAQGVVNFHVDVKINMDEFARWSPDRITSFFAGIAQVLAAKGAIEKGASKEK